MSSAVPAVESRIADHLSRGDFDGAVTAAIRSYGPEILGFLAARERDESAASEAFSDFCEDLWRGVRSYRGQSTFRTWAYTLARNAAHRRRRDPYVRRGIPLSQAPTVLQVVEKVRTTTLMHLRTEVRDKVTALRERLPEEDRDLLVLRVDRDMAWADIARVFEGPEAPEESLRQRSASLRKRFERTKRRLKEMARAEGLLGGDG